MGSRSCKLCVAAALACAAGPGRGAPPPLAVPNPTYASVVVEIPVNRPARQVWARVGKFCDVGEWLRYSCTIIAGKDGELGAVRLVHGDSIEILVGKTDLSYTYTFPVRAGVPFNAMHSTVEAKPVTATTAKLIYSSVYDNSLLPDDSARAEQMARRRARLTEALRNMKTVAESGKLPPTAGQ